MSVKVLIIDDEEQMRKMIRVYLHAYGMEVTEAENGETALHLLKTRSFDTIILDVMMPVMDGFTFLKTYSMNIPILVLSAKSQMEDKLKGFDLGVDDYLTKPFDMRELVARIQALVKRAGKRSDQKRKEFNLNRESHTLIVWDEEVFLTPKEFEILELLSNHSKRVFSRDELFIQIWRDEHEGEERVIDTHVKHIRDKCKKAGLSFNPVLTVWGVGYRFGGSQE
ncbi:response regulator transcription factor [Fodinisporobacter ferrooxydans]|uniref:Response regulator transcription factor n=1 Tax=Fodinisporobacter ferrooxydans TaxID=2901836 RepID=A0ABY4CPT1_9BACL|nr:response regulator transcription factor [Alicyclobacillaceae bacterium MYW30-H2]